MAPAQLTMKLSNCQALPRMQLGARLQAQQVSGVYGTSEHISELNARLTVLRDTRHSVERSASA
jgi:hypothetical protein